MLIKELKIGENVTIKMKPEKFLDSKEIEKEGKKLKLEKWECEDEDGERIVVTFFGDECIERVNNNISEWIMLNKFYVTEYEEKKQLSSAKWGYIKKIY